MKNHSMDLATVLGLLGAVALLGGAAWLAGGVGVEGFVDLPSAVMVCGGAAAAMLIALPLRAVLGARRALRRVLVSHQPDLNRLIETLVSLSAAARRDGLLSLEPRLEEIDDPLLADGLRMAVDGARADVIEDVLRTEIDAVALRHRNTRAVFEQTARCLPAFGMIGTLVGLVVMLGSLRSPEAIAPGMAIALLTTLYGLVIANLFFLPVAEKLAFLSRQEIAARELVLCGVLAIQLGDPPHIVQQRLEAFLPRAERRGEEKAPPAATPSDPRRSPLATKLSNLRRRAA
jgi:chemotaxis protein MotA